LGGDDGDWGFNDRACLEHGEQRPGICLVAVNELRWRRAYKLHEHYLHPHDQLELGGGYVVPGISGEFSQVYGSWFVPSITCSPHSPNVVEAAAFWAGLDGDPSTTVEQAGTTSLCQSNGIANYSAWYEFYPGPPVPVLNVHPGNIITVAVVCLSCSSVCLTIKDVTTRTAATACNPRGSDAFSSAECVVERPYLGTGFGWLAEFGTGYFGEHYTSIPSTCFAETWGYGLQSFASLGAVGVTMVDGAGVVLASPGSLGGGSFTVTFERTS
jgi:Peptidase A4 family